MTTIKKHFTPTERRLMNLLETGRLCRRPELEACLDDELAGPVALSMHLCQIRKKLPPGQTLIHATLGRTNRGWLIVRELRVED